MELRVFRNVLRAGIKELGLSAVGRDRWHGDDGRKEWAGRSVLP